MEVFGNRRRKAMASQSLPIACCVCDRVFFDNVSLVLHFDESHDVDELIGRSRTPADWQPVSVNLHQFLVPPPISDIANVPFLSSPFDSQIKLLASALFPPVTQKLKSCVCMSQKPGGSLLNQSIFYSQFTPSKVASKWINEQSGRGFFPFPGNSQHQQSGEGCEEVTGLGDGGEEANKNSVKTLDLTLRL